ncbi:FadR family transcriptional regulator [Croceicoccus sp. YJ47]|nr:FadR family transcriptional regulator [Croceicoccus sp. YJ47]
MSGRRERMNQLVARKIGTEILKGERPPGSGFRGEIEEADAWGVSRTVYREAMRSLIAKGLIESRPRRGTHVRDPHHWNLLDLDILSWILSDEPDPAFSGEIFELRAIIEPAAAAMAAKRRSDAHLARMEDALNQMERAGLGTDEGRLADRAFHAAIFDASGNNFFIALSAPVEAAVGMTTRFKQENQAEPRDSLPDHQAVFAAIAKRDADAASRAMAKLVTLAWDDMRLAVGGRD